MDGLGRWRILRLHVEDGIPLTALASDTGTGLRTLQRWHHLYKIGGVAALELQPRADAGARRIPAELVAFIEGLALSSATNAIKRSQKTATKRSNPHARTPSITGANGFAWIAQRTTRGYAVSMSALASHMSEMRSCRRQTAVDPSV